MFEIVNTTFVKIYCATYSQEPRYKNWTNKYYPPQDTYFKTKEELDNYLENNCDIRPYITTNEVMALEYEGIIYPLGKPIHL